MARRLYIYYRVAEPQLAATVAAVRAMQAAAAASHPGLHAELLRRPGARDGEVTLMETYAGALAEAALATIAALAANLPQPRSTEVFDTLD